MEDKQLLQDFGITKEQVEEWALEAEQGDLDGYKINATIKGRPRIFGEEMESITVRIPKSKAEDIQEEAKRCGVSKSEWCRQAMFKALKAS